MTTKAEILRTIRAHCDECSGSSAKERLMCPARTCGMFLYKDGKDPNPSKSKAEAARVRMKKNNGF